MRIETTATLPVPCGGRGIASVAVGFVDGQVTPLVWEEARSCDLYSIGDLVVGFAGAFFVLRAENGDLLIRLDGNVPAIDASVRADFVLSGPRLESRVATPTGDVIASRDGDAIIARAQNGTFRCDPVRRRCVSSVESSSPVP